MTDSSPAEADGLLLDPLVESWVSAASRLEVFVSEVDPEPALAKSDEAGTALSAGATSSPVARAPELLHATQDIVIANGTRGRIHYLCTERWLPQGE